MTLEADNVKNSKNNKWATISRNLEKAVLPLKITFQSAPENNCYQNHYSEYTNLFKHTNWLTKPEILAEKSPLVKIAFQSALDFALDNNFYLLLQTYMQPYSIQIMT